MSDVQVLGQGKEVSGLGVQTEHPDYSAYKKRWLRIYDVLEGQDVIAAPGKPYLPKPGGIRDLERSERFEDREIATEEWNSYKGRATFPTWTRDAVRSMSGLVRKLDQDVKLPSRLEYITESATGDGFTLEQLLVRVVAETLSYGRCVLWVDVNDQGNPYIATYNALSFINWKESKGTSGSELKLAVLVEKKETGDEFSHLSEDTWRVISFDENGNVIVRVFDENTSNPEAISPRAFGDKPLKSIPLVVVGSRDNAPDVDDIPLEGMALAALQYYRVSADYYKTLHMSSHPILVVKGSRISTDNGTVDTGPAVAWDIPADADVKYVEASGQGAERQRAEMDRLKSSAMEIGAKAMDTSGAESGEARKARQDDQRATLATCVTTAAQGIERALRYCAEYLGIDPGEVQYNVKPDFEAHDVDPQMIAQLSALVTSGVISPESLFNYIRTGKMPEHDYADEILQIESAQGTIGNPEDREA